MSLKELDLHSDNHFVAMEYYGLILNRTYLIVLFNNQIIGLQGNGMVSVEGGRDIFTRNITAGMAVRGDLSNPYSYLKEKYIRAIENEDLLSDQVLAASKANFRINKNDIVEVKYDPTKKWGMGPYPHDGKVYITTGNGKRREFIILGARSGEKIVDDINTM